MYTLIRSITDKGNSIASAPRWRKKLAYSKNWKNANVVETRKHPDHCRNNIFESDMLGVSKKS